jgi:carboxylate-amine ligase
MADQAENFASRGTIGVEEEFYIVDEDGRPVSGTDDLVYGADPPAILADRLDHELFQCTIETQTPILESVDAVRETLADIRSALCAHAADHGYRIAAAGLPPSGNWRELEHAQKPRYQQQLDRIQYPQHRNLTSGVHVHVGVDDAECATWVANECRRHLPAMLALSANSPFWCGVDTGLASARAKIFEALPNTGMPTTFASFADYVDYEERMIETGSIDDRGELWFDVRPHTELGTVEIRTPDAQADLERVVALVEWAVAIVDDLAERYADGASGTDPRREFLDENKWRAMRHGREASFLGLPSAGSDAPTPTTDGPARSDGEGTVDLATVVERECDRLGTDAPRRLFDLESGTERQRRIAREDGFDALQRSIVLDARAG